MTANTHPTPALRHPTTARLDVLAAVSRYLTTLGRAPSVLHLTAPQWEQLLRESPRRPELGVVPAGDATGDTALSCLIGGVCHTVPVRIVVPEPSEGVTAYRRQYDAENTPVQNHALSGATHHA